MAGNDKYVSTLLNFNGADASTVFTDESMNELRIWTPNGNAQLSTTSPKFGSAAALFDGTGDWIDTPDSADFACPTQDFTIDFWVKRGVKDARQVMCGQMSSLGSYISGLVEFQANNTLRAMMNKSDNSTTYICTSTGTITDTTTWHHIAFERVGDQLRLYIDGVLDGTANVTGITLIDSAYKYSIGRGGEYTSLYLNGRIDAFRFSKGIARWTAEFSGSLPSAEWSPVNSPHPDGVWCIHTTKAGTEHSIIRSSEAFVPAYKSTNAGGLYILSMTDGSQQHYYGDPTYGMCAPIVSGGFIFVYDYVAKTVKRIQESDGTVTHTLSSLSSIDFESMGWDTTNSRIILPIATALRAYSMADLSQAWTNEDIDSALYQSGSPLVVGNYIYWKPNNGSTLYKLNLADGTVADQADTLGTLSSTYSYAGPIYDEDHNYVYCLGTDAQVHCIDISDMSVVWSKTLGTGMTTPRIHNAIAYHNGKVIVPVRDEGAGNKSKIYALSYVNGDISWTNTSPWDDGQEAATPLLGVDRLVIGAADNADLTLGYLYIISLADGSLISKDYLMYGITCGGVSAVSGGKVIVNEHAGYVECINLGSGALDDSEYYMKNVYHNGYAGSRLAFASTLVVDNLAHLNALGALVLTQVHNLTVANMAHADAIGNVVLTQVHKLAVEALSHGHSIDGGLTLSQIHQLAVNPLNHAHGIGGLTLSQVHNLLIQNLINNHSISNVDLVENILLTIQNLLHSNSIGSPNLIQDYKLIVQSLLHANSITGYLKLIQIIEEGFAYKRLKSERLTTSDGSLEFKKITSKSEMLSEGDLKYRKVN